VVLLLAGLAGGWGCLTGEAEPPFKATVPLGPTLASRPVTTSWRSSKVRLPVSPEMGCFRKDVLREPLLKAALPLTMGSVAGPVTAKLIAALPPPS